MSNEERSESDQSVENQRAARRASDAWAGLRTNRDIKKQLARGGIVTLTPIPGIALTFHEDPDDTLTFLCRFSDSSGQTEAVIKTESFRFPIPEIPIREATVEYGNPVNILAAVMEQCREAVARDNTR